MTNGTNERSQRLIERAKARVSIDALIERARDPDIKTMNLIDHAYGMIKLYEAGDEVRTRELFEEYVTSCARDMDLEEAKGGGYGNLYDAAMIGNFAMVKSIYLGDCSILFARDRAEKLGEGPVIEFFKRAVSSSKYPEVVERGPYGKQNDN